MWITTDKIEDEIRLVVASTMLPAKAVVLEATIRRLPKKKRQRFRNRLGIGNRDQESP